MPKKLSARIPDRSLSNLEMTVLGLAWLRGPCTIYSIMRELSMSASSYHKSRAGTAYSVSNRLLEFGLIERSGAEAGSVAITSAGVEALKDWMAPPVSRADIAHSADLVRLRFFFLGALEQKDRLRFIDDCIAGLDTFLGECEALMPKNEEIGDYFGVLATLSTVFETRARIQWLKVVRRWVENPLPENAPWAEIVMRESRGCS